MILLAVNNSDDIANFSSSVVRPNTHHLIIGFSKYSRKYYGILYNSVLKPRPFEVIKFIKESVKDQRVLDDLLIYYNDFR